MLLIAVSIYYRKKDPYDSYLLNVTEGLTHFSQYMTIKVMHPFMLVKINSLKEGIHCF